MRGDRSVCGSQCGRDGDRGEETVQPQRRRSFSLGTAAVSGWAPESELTRHVKEMNFLSAHRSSNPICPATQSVSPMCRNGLLVCVGAMPQQIYEVHALNWRGRGGSAAIS